MRQAISRQPTYPVEDYEEDMARFLSAVNDRGAPCENHGPSWVPALVIFASVIVGGFMAAWLAWAI